MFVKNPCEWINFRFSHILKYHYSFFNTTTTTTWYHHHHHYYYSQSILYAASRVTHLAKQTFILYPFLCSNLHSVEIQTTITTTRRITLPLTTTGLGHKINNQGIQEDVTTIRTKGKCCFLEPSVNFL